MKFLLQLIIALSPSVPLAVSQAQIPGSEQPPLPPLPHPEIPPPTLWEPGIPLWIYIAGTAVILFMLAIVIWMLLRPAKLRAQADVAPLDRARKRLEELQKSLDSLPPGEIGHQVSVILRGYQEGRYSVPAPYRTRQELYETQSPMMRADLQERFSPIAELCDRLAFAPAVATRDAAAQLIETALGTLQDEHQSKLPTPPPLPLSQSQTV
jgi:hypothetical protein